MEKISEEERPENTPKVNKKNPIILFLSALLTIFLTILVLLSGLLAFCAFDKRSSLASIPRDYSFYLHSDSAFDTLNPLFDLQAADVILSSQNLSFVRKPFMDFRGSDLRDNSLFQFATSRPVDLAIYGQGRTLGKNLHFVAAVNLGLFSLLSRVGQFMYPKMNLQIENLSYEQNEELTYFVYSIPPVRNDRGRVIKEEVKFYFRSLKNLVIVSDSLDYLLKSCLSDNDSSYTTEQKNLFKAKSRGEIRIVANASSLLDAITLGNPMLSSMAKLVHDDSLSVISFNINDSDVLFNCRLPLSTDVEIPSPLFKLLSAKPTVPSLLTRFSDITQYYTILNAASLQDLKDALLPFVPDVKNPDEYWENCDEWSKSLLGMDLEELLFSWTSDEFAVLGVENQNDPVFVLQIKDEKKRQNVFNRLTSSILIKDDNSLILGGVRLPRLQLPSFFNWMLGLFGINLPSPYFVVLDGNIYFSESPESLSAIYTNAQSGKSLVKNESYNDVSGDLKNDVLLSLFYNLERSVPFFLRSNETFSKVLQLYTMGRFDVRTEKNNLEMNLHACARRKGSLYSVPGFPISLEGKADAANLQSDSGKNPQNVYWVEGGNTVKALNVASMSISSKTDSDKIYIVASSKDKSGGTLWSLTSYGVVSLLNPKLECVRNFPLMLGENISCRPCSVGENLVAVSEHGTVYIIKSDGSMVTVEIPGLSAKSEPVSLDNGKTFAIYSKGFLGKIYLFEDEKCVNLDNPFEIPGIALGSPAIMKSGSKTYIGFITQAGEMNVWRTDSLSGEQAERFPLRLGGVFMTNVVASDKYFYALSNDGLLYRISLDASVLTVQIPNSSAKEGYICVRDRERNGRKSVFVCADANVIYGFNENLELLSGFPLAGWGKPVFADVNGDKIGECIALTIDKKLVAWKVR